MATKDSKEAIAILFGELFFDLLRAVAKAQSVEPEFSQIQDALKGVTQAEMRRIALAAGEYFADHAKSEAPEMTRAQVAALKRKALESALKTR